MGGKVPNDFWRDLDDGILPPDVFENKRSEIQNKGRLVDLEFNNIRSSSKRLETESQKEKKQVYQEETDFFSALFGVFEKMSFNIGEGIGSIFVKSDNLMLI